MRNLRGNSGFTMAETLIVIAIMAVLSTIALPSFYTWTSSIKYREAAWSIMSDLRLGRQLAMSTNLEHRVEFDVVGKRYRVTRGNRSTGSTAWAGVNAWKEASRDISLLSGSGCDSASDTNVTFLPNGSSGASTICVMGNGVVKYLVSVNAFSGRASVN